MKKYIIIITFLYINAKPCIAQSSWVTTHDTVWSLASIDTGSNIVHTPVYIFATPSAATVFDTLNIKFYYHFTTDSAVSFQILEHQYAQFDSAHTDTLGFIVNTMMSSTNSILTTSQDIPISNGFKGVEISSTYYDADVNKVLVTYTRLYYYKTFMLTFTVRAYQDHLSQLNTNKDLFFNSITFGSGVGS
jgi:hypothetical protein